MNQNIENRKERRFDQLRHKYHEHERERKRSCVALHGRAILVGETREEVDT
jgi:hypothetical protein